MTSFKNPLLFLFILAWSSGFHLAQHPYAAETSYGAGVRTLTLKVRAERRALPDVAEFRVRVITKGASVKQALEKNSEKIAALKKIFLKEGISEADFRTSDLSIAPVFESVPVAPSLPPQQKKSGYQATLLLSFMVKDLARVGAFFDRAAALEGDVFPEVFFSVKAPESVLDLARQDAVAEAQKRALLYAQASHTQLGKLLSLSEAEEPSRRAFDSMTMSVSPISASTSLVPGEISFETEIKVVWEILE